MKRVRRKAAGVVAMLLVCIMIFGTAAYAGTELSSFSAAISGTKKIAITSPKKALNVYVGGIDGTVTAKSSKKGVVACGTFTEPYKLSDGSTVPLYGVKIKAKKVGKTKVTVTYAHSKGTVTRSVTLIAYKWSNPFNTLKIGKKSLAKLFKKTDDKTIVPMSGKLKIKMNSKFKSLKVYYKPNGGSAVRISKSANVTLKSGDLLIFQFNDNKNRVRNSEAVLRIR